jgi:hypothetical protein
MRLCDTFKFWTRLRCVANALINQQVVLEATDDARG